jgi:radical SAM superfamily enzyme YgiQ (UPF0313 family)
MKTLLIVPPLLMEKRYNEYSSAAGTSPPLGIGYIAAVLKKNHYQVKIIDSLVENLTLNELTGKIKKYDPDIIGLTVNSINYNNLLKFGGLIKEINKDIKIVVGGPHISADPSGSIKDSPFDFGVYGEGDYIYLELVKALEKNKNFDNIKGLIYKKGHKVIKNPPRAPIQNLDEIPFPARELFSPLKNYKLSIFYYKRYPVTTQITSRGCPYHCIFCDNNVFGHTFRGHSPEYVVDEMELLKEKFKMKEIMFYDDTFTLNKKRVLDICDEIKKRKLDILWSAGARVNTVDKNLLSKMKKAGCWNISYGIETGNPGVMKFIKKGINLSQVEKVVRESVNTGLEVRGLFMLGHPTETKKTLRDTIEFAKSLPFHSVNFSITHPIIGTELYDLADQYGYFNKEKPEEGTGHPSDPIFVPHGITKKDLLDAQRKGYLEFYLNPTRILRILKKINSLEDIKKYSRGFPVVIKLLTKKLRKR